MGPIHTEKKYKKMNGRKGEAERRRAATRKEFYRTRVSNLLKSIEKGTEDFNFYLNTTNLNYRTNRIVNYSL